MATKYYVVWAGRETGIFTSWPQTKALVDGFAGAKYRSFKTEAEAKAAFNRGSGAASTAKASTSKTPTAKSAAKTSANAVPDSDIDIYTDGGCEPNPGKAGSGLALYQQGVLAELWYGLYNPTGTNNTAELNALHQALLMAENALSQGKSVHIHSDSQYSLNCVTNWAYGWKAKGWKRKTAGDIANLAIIQAAHEIYDKLKDKLKISHVAAHIGIEGNELADRMSIYAIDQQTTDFCRYPAPFALEEILALHTG
ncbi:ribonuclease H family protein [Shewanella sp. Isolate11]|uniref:ribonuclease H family protein n=1 Tax=Shewanella sp. Isolate11 TaxID=2908530 RepID=UPI001EFCAB9D|nr:ribonuclease H family protein [Shewanella sp. Isolate11]MCG9696904.1 ribonuclease H family protein [Shewanella sp. Isolate11]